MKAIVKAIAFFVSIMAARYYLFFLIISGLASCQNDIKKIEELTTLEVMPDEVGVNIKITQTDSGRLKLTLEAPLLERYFGEAEYAEFSKGIDVKFYDKYGEISSRIKANYAINYMADELVVAKENVEVWNEKGEKLNTEKLHWDRKEKKLTSDVFVKITTPTEVIYGDGLDAKEDFSSYKIRNIKGIIKVKESNANP